MEIKFKAKRKDNNEWVYGNYFHNFRKGESHNIVEFDTNTWHEVIPETVCIALPLFDKESTQIYTNDLLDFDEKEWGGEFEPEQVEWDNIIGDWGLSGSISDLRSWRKITGNKFD